MVKPYSVRVARQNRTVTIRLGGEIDLCAGPALRLAVADMILGEPPTLLVFDLTDTTFADSTAMNMMALAHHAAAMVGASVEVKSNLTVDRVLAVAGVAGLFDTGSGVATAG